MTDGSTLPLADIKIGERFRKNLGDIDGLAGSIAEVGLLHPVVVTANGVLVAGQRRLEAVRRLGWERIPVRVIDLDDLLRAEHDENEVRKDFTPSEAVAVYRAAFPKAKERAKQRQAHGQTAPGKNAPPNFGEASERSETGKAHDLASHATGKSAETVRKAAKVVEAAEDDPETFGPLVEQMDSTGKVDGAYREFKARERERKRQQDREKAAAVTPPDRIAPHPTIVIDPPWDWGDEGDHDQLGRARPDYATMSLAELEALDIPAMPDAHLYLWITNRSLPKGFWLLERWGFRYVTCLTWVKPHYGMGNYFRGSTEHVLFGVKGSLPLRRKDVGTHFAAPRGSGQHSAKPDEFYDLVESCSPAPYLDMFGRRDRDGWAVWGSQ